MQNYSKMSINSVKLVFNNDGVLVCKVQMNWSAGVTNIYAAKVRSSYIFLTSTLLINSLVNI